LMLWWLRVGKILFCGCPLGNDSKKFLSFFIIIDFTHMDVFLSHWTLISVLLPSASCWCMWIMVLSPNTYVSLTNFHHCFLLFCLNRKMSAYLVIKQILLPLSDSCCLWILSLSASLCKFSWCLDIDYYWDITIFHPIRLNNTSWDVRPCSNGREES
jgi:hypothetical protein